MNLIKSISQCNINCVYFCEPIKNNVMINGSFTRILYSSHIFTMNGIYLMVPLTDVTIEKYYKKYKCTFNSHINLKIIEKLCDIELKLLVNDKIFISFGLTLWFSQILQIDSSR